MSTPQSQNQLPSPERWEDKEAQIRLERAEEFSQLTPAEQAKILTGEHEKFLREREKTKQEMRYGEFNPAAKENAQEKAAREKREQEQTAKELAALEGKTKGGKPAPKEKGQSREQREKERAEKFKTYFNAAGENIEKKVDFQFKSAALNDFGKEVVHHARMIKITDHSQKADLKPEEIWKRYEKKEAKEGQIGLQIEINMGEEKNNNLGLTNLKMEIALSSLIDNTFSEQMKKFTNMVFFAAHMHDRQVQLLPATPEAAREQKKKPDGKENKQQKALDQAYKQYSINQAADHGGLEAAAGYFEQERTGTVAFAFNNGDVWGTFDSASTPVSTKELQEALDKINQEK